MTEKQQPPIKGKPSGQHPAVKEYRRKLQSIQDGVLSELEGLDAAITQEVDSLPPPPPAPEKA